MNHLDRHIFPIFPILYSVSGAVPIQLTCGLGQKTLSEASKSLLLLCSNVEGMRLFQAKVLNIFFPSIYFRLIQTKEKMHFLFPRLLIFGQQRSKKAGCFAGIVVI